MCGVPHLALPGQKSPKLRAADQLAGRKLINLDLLQSSRHELHHFHEHAFSHFPLYGFQPILNMDSSQSLLTWIAGGGAAPKRWCNEEIRKERGQLEIRINAPDQPRLQGLSRAKLSEPTYTLSTHNLPLADNELMDPSLYILARPPTVVTTRPATSGEKNLPNNQPFHFLLHSLHFLLLLFRNPVIEPTNTAAASPER